MGLINLWTDPRYFDVDKFVDSNGIVPAEFLQSAFLTLKPIANLIEKPTEPRLNPRESSGMWADMRSH